MSTTEDDDTLTTLSTTTDSTNENKSEPNLNLEAFIKMCNITVSEENCNVSEMSTSDINGKSSKESNVLIDRKKEKNQTNKPSAFEQFSYPCLPKINCTEKIIFCIDMSSCMQDLKFKKNDGSQYSPLKMVKRIIEIFIHNKNFLDKKHEYSIMVLYESATWVREFTNDPVEIIDSLEDLNETQACDSCDFASIVQLITEKFELIVSSTLLPVHHIIRVILVYGRSDCMFHFSDECLQDVLMRHPYIFLDILYIHDPPSEHNKCKDIYEALCDLDEQNKSYIFEVTHNVTKLHNCMAKLLAHPLQRSAQKDSFYKIREIKAIP